MKYLVVILALGALAYTTYAAPASSNIQQDDTDPTNEREFLNLISRVAKTSQSDDDNDDTLAEAQWGFLKNIGRQLRRLSRNRIVKKFAKKLAEKALNKMMSHLNGPQQDNGAGENALIEDDDVAEAESDALVQAFLEKAMERDSEMKAAIESLPEEARSQFWGHIVRSVFG